jgi:hypothetical protein
MNILLLVEPWVFFFVAIGLFALLGVLAYQKKTGGAFVALLGAVLSASFGYLDHISEIAATATSLTIKVREASDALVGLRKVAALTGAALINLDAQSGSIGGDTANHRDQLKQQVLETLRSIGVDEAMVRQVADEDRNRNLADYVWGINNHVEYCALIQARQSEWQNDFGALGWPPSPDSIQKLLDKYDVHDEFTNKAVDEYRDFVRTGEHRDAQFWSDRDSWPTDKRKCRG